MQFSIRDLFLSITLAAIFAAILSWAYSNGHNLANIAALTLLGGSIIALLQRKRLAMYIVFFFAILAAMMLISVPIIH